MTIKIRASLRHSGCDVIVCAVSRMITKKYIKLRRKLDMNWQHTTWTLQSDLEHSLDQQNKLKSIYSLFLERSKHVQNFQP